jgi:AGCS family alanine or glycine:cation symporter
VDHAWQSDLVGFKMTSAAFAAAFPLEVFGIAFGTLVASVALLLFVFTTLLTWSYYGQRAITFLYDLVPGSSARGEKVLHTIWRIVWCLVIFVGSFAPLGFVWRLGDISNAAMALPNLIALAALSGVVFAIAKGANSEQAAGGE